MPLQYRFYPGTDFLQERRYCVGNGGQTPLQYRFYPGTDFLQERRYLCRKWGANAPPVSFLPRKRFLATEFKRSKLRNRNIFKTIILMV